MPAILNSLTALTVATIYYGWRAYLQLHLRKIGTLHERVAFMLWIVAT